MTYLLWQIFACLLATAVLFFFLGWALRAWWRHKTAADHSITESERTSWQTSLDGMRARLETETSRTLAAEKGLADAQGQASKLSSLLDQHSIQIRNLTQEIAGRDQALKQRDASIEDLQARATEAEMQLADRDKKLEGVRTLSDENSKLKGQLADAGPKLAAAVAAGVELAMTRGRIAELEPKLETANQESAKLKSQVTEMTGNLSATAEENKKLKAQMVDLQSQASKLPAAEAELGKLRTEVSELTPKLAMAAAAGAEVVALKAHVAKLEPQVSKLQTSDAELDQLRIELSSIKQQLQSSADENGRLKAVESELNQKLLDWQTTGADTSKHLPELAKLKAHIGELEPQLADRDAKLRTAHDELASFKKRWAEHEGELMRLRTQLGELEPQVGALEAEVKTLRLELTTLEPEIHSWETRYTTVVAAKDAELAACRSRVSELDGQLAKQPAMAAADHVPEKGQRDDLKKIYGIGPVLEKRLNGLGVYFFREIAMWTKEDILRYEEHLKEFPDRIERDNWVEGARQEHFKKYGEQLLKAQGAEG